MKKVLFVTSVVDDARELDRRARNHWRVTVPPDPADAPDLIASGLFDFAFFDVALTGACAPDLLRAALSAREGFTVFILTREYAPCFGKLARESGASGFFMIPYRFLDLKRRVEEALEKRVSPESTPSSAREARVPYGKGAPAPFLRSPVVEGDDGRDYQADVCLVGDSATMERLRARVRALAENDSAVLIRGETGSGKEVVARLIHNGSRVATGPFIPCNASCIAESLAESALFGSSKGSYTGSVRDVAGLFEEADGGTLFLDEIGELDIRLQPKFLRILEEGVVKRLGSTTPRRVRFRLICATNRDLAAMVAARRFRADLFYRLDVLRLEVPPLRDHPEDIPALARRRMVRYRKVLSPRAIDTLKAYHWPGNVRQLYNCLDRAACESGGYEVDLQHICF